MNACEVKDALRGRHHAAGGTGAMVGEWTCLEELWGIDLLAWSAWGKCERVGYEVKVSRSDYRRELLAPHKRARAVGLCHRFYFAVPAGLLTKDELAYREPGDLRPGDFEREPCPGFDMGGPVHVRHRQPLFGDPIPPRPIYGGRCSKRRRQERQHHVTVPRPAVFPAHSERTRLYGPDGFEVRELDGITRIVCPTCEGRGYVAKSRVEEEAPTLWVPADVGLVAVHESGTTRVLRKAPLSRDAGLPGPKQIADAIRWASVRPDPRHTYDRQTAPVAA